MHDGDNDREGDRRAVRQYFEPLDDEPPQATRGATGGFARTFLIVTVIIFVLFPVIAYLFSTYHLAPSGLPRLP